MFFSIDRCLAAAALTASLAAPAALVAPGMAHAQQGATVNPPPGCTAFLTVQSRSCTVSHMWTCEGDPEGTHWRMSMDNEGPFYLSFTDEEFRWLLSYRIAQRRAEYADPTRGDPASITELFETGTDSMVSRQSTNRAAAVQRDYTGFDRLTGETVEIDGAP